MLFRLCRELFFEALLSLQWDSSNNFNAAVLRASKEGHVSDSFSVDVGLFTSTMEVFLTVSICDEQEGSSYSKGDEVCLLAHIHPAVAAAQVNSMLLILKSRGRPSYEDDDDDDVKVLQRVGAIQN